MEVGNGDDSSMFVGTALTSKLSEHIYALDQSFKLPGYKCAPTAYWSKPFLQNRI